MQVFWFITSSATYFELEYVDGKNDVHFFFEELTWILWLDSACRNDILVSLLFVNTFVPITDFLVLGIPWCNKGFFISYFCGYDEGCT